MNGILLRPVLLFPTITFQNELRRVENDRLLTLPTNQPLDGFLEIKVTAGFKRIDVVPSIRGFHIRRTASQTNRRLKRSRYFVVAIALSCLLPPVMILNSSRELKWNRSMRTCGNRDTPTQFSIKRMFGAFTRRSCLCMRSWSPRSPAQPFQPLARLKKSLAGKPETGDTGDLYLSVAEMVAHHLPSACVFENVPAFGNSLACLSRLHHLQRIGYSIAEIIVDPWNEWNEPQDRKRWIMIATLKPGFQIHSPRTPFTGNIDKFL